MKRSSFLLIFFFLVEALCQSSAGPGVQANNVLELEGSKVLLQPLPPVVLSFVQLWDPARALALRKS